MVVMVIVMLLLLLMVVCRRYVSVRSVEGAGVEMEVSGGCRRVVEVYHGGCLLTLFAG